MTVVKCYKGILDRLACCSCTCCEHACHIFVYACAEARLAFAISKERQDKLLMQLCSVCKMHFSKCSQRWWFRRVRSGRGKGGWGRETCATACKTLNMIISPDIRSLICSFKQLKSNRSFSSISQPPCLPSLGPFLQTILILEEGGALVLIVVFITHT